MSSSKHLRVVERVVQAEAREAEIDRQRPLDLVAAVVEQLALVGDRRRHAVADDVHRHRPLVEEAEVEQLHPERPAADAEQRAVGPEADVPVGVEIEPVERLGQRAARRRRRARRRGRAPGAPRPRSGTGSAPARRRGCCAERRRGARPRQALQEAAAGRAVIMAARLALGGLTARVRGSACEMAMRRPRPSTGPRLTKAEWHGLCGRC